MALTDNMVPAYYWDGRSNGFLTYGASGFTQLAYTNTANNVYNTLVVRTPSTGIVYSPGEAVPGGAATVYALRAGGPMSGGTITVGDGTDPAGVIFAASATQTPTSPSTVPKASSSFP